MSNKGIYVKPWTRQRELKKKYTAEEVPGIDELANIISDIQIGKINKNQHTLRARALFAMYYLTGCRASEIVRSDKHSFEGIQKKAIKLAEEDGRECLYIRTQNRKHKTRRTKRQPIPVSKERIIANFVWDYIKTLEDDSVLFDFRRQRAIQIINETTGFNIHFIRHIRATHLVTLYDFNEQVLIKFMGWTDARPAKHYMELRTADVFKAFYKNDKVEKE